MRLRIDPGGLGGLPLLTLPLLLAFSAACEDPLALPQAIENTRVIGARAEVRERPGQAWAEPGESVDVSWLVVAPDGEPMDLSWSFEACLAVPVNAGPAECKGSAFETFTGQGTPAFSFTVPTDTGDAPQVALHGVVCRGGEPGEGFDACSTGDALPVGVNLGIAGGELQNSLPSLSAVELFLGDQPWSSPPAALPTDCALDDALPRVSARSKTRIRLDVASVARDELGEERAGFDQIGDRETLEVDWYADAGKLSTPAGFVEADDDRANPTLEVTFEAPKLEAGVPRWVRFYFVSRDRRGGSDWLRRGLCVVP